MRIQNTSKVTIIGDMGFAFLLADLKDRMIGEMNHRFNSNPANHELTNRLPIINLHALDTKGGLINMQEQILDNSKNGLGVAIIANPDCNEDMQALTDWIAKIQQYKVLYVNPDSEESVRHEEKCNILSISGNKITPIVHEIVNLIQ